MQNSMGYERFVHKPCALAASDLDKLQIPWRLIELDAASAPRSPVEPNVRAGALVRVGQTLASYRLTFRDIDVLIPCQL